jgi:NAD dependent epimerase/dehydratase family enzyme
MENLEIVPSWESDRAGDDFLAAVCREWEAAADIASPIRTVKLRTGLVLDPTGGALGKMLPLFRFGLGGKLGSGKTVVVLDHSARCSPRNYLRT